MDEEQKYFKLSGGGIEPGGATIVVACKPDEVERLREKCKDFELTETERPENTRQVNAEPMMPNPGLFVLRNPYAYISRDPIEREAWGGACCARCQNRYNLRSDYCQKHQNDNRCYRFKLAR